MRRLEFNSSAVATILSKHPHLRDPIHSYPTINPDSKLLSKLALYAGLSQNMATFVPFGSLCWPLLFPPARTILERACCSGGCRKSNERRSQALGFSHTPGSPPTPFHLTVRYNHRFPFHLCDVPPIELFYLSAPKYLYLGLVRTNPLTQPFPLPICSVGGHRVSRPVFPNSASSSPKYSSRYLLAEFFGF